MVVLALLAGFLGGVAIGFQSPLASLMSEKIGWLESAFVIHLGGVLLAGLPLIVLTGGRLSGWRQVPPAALGAGALGVILVGAVSYSIPRVGVTATLAVVMAGQFIVAAILDHFGLIGADVRHFNFTRAAGIAVLFLGTWLITR